ncbi:MAG TPA: anti-sigma factor [Pseudonocardiaceae bacterium]|nr:anti-sigma factor [Pseudonocardiaceae bacterium]
MSAVEHDHEALGAYTLGALAPDEARAVDAHLAECADCRREVAELTELRGMLDSVPPEAFLDGPPDDGELLLQRTLRQMRAKQGGQPRLARFPAAAGVVVIALAALGAGVLLGRQTAPGGEAQGPQSSVVQAPPGTRNGEVTNPANGVSMAVSLTPATGWVRVHAVIRGIPAGKPCQLLVVSQDGNTVLAGSWLVSDKGARDGTSLDGSALVDPNKVSSVDVVTTAGEELVSVSI